MLPLPVPERLCPTVVPSGKVTLACASARRPSVDAAAFAPFLSRRYGSNRYSVNTYETSGLVAAAAATSTDAFAAIPAAAEPLLERGVADNAGEREKHPGDPRWAGDLAEHGDTHQQNEQELEVSQDLSRRGDRRSICQLRQELRSDAVRE